MNQKKGENNLFALTLCFRQKVISPEEVRILAVELGNQVQHLVFLEEPILFRRLVSLVLIYCRVDDS